MRTTEIINHRKDGNLEAQRILLMAEGSGLKEIYGKVMAMFLRQGILIERMFLQIQGDDLTFAIHGSNGNILYMELPNHNNGKKLNFPVKGDFLLEGEADGALYKDDQVTIQTIYRRFYRVESKDGKLYTVPQDKIMLDKK